MGMSLNQFELDAQLATLKSCGEARFRLRWPRDFLIQARDTARVGERAKRWQLGTHHGPVGRQHLGSYSDEFTFRFRSRRSGRRGKLFYRHSAGTRGSRSCVGDVPGVPVLEGAPWTTSSSSGHGVCS